MVMETGTRLARTLSHAARHPAHVGVLWSKFLAHVDGSYVSETRRRGEAFARAHAGQFDPSERAMAPALWLEAKEFEARLSERAETVMGGVRSKFGGGGCSTLLYYLTRAAAPKTIVETGVAAGWSSAAFLAALQRNGSGRLWSSDFPYLDRGNKLEEIGLLVPAELRSSWRLFTDGDRINLPKILKVSGPIDLFHYDSDKTYRGRSFALDLVRPHLAAGASLVRRYPG
jgi:hypothetical protein